jgi:hypothetical protein
VDEANKKLLYSVAGTRSGTDVFNDIRLATGGLKTRRDTNLRTGRLNPHGISMTDTIRL